MGLFTKDKKGNLYDYLDEKVDKAEIKAICSNEINEIKFLKLALYIVSTYISSAISTCEFKIYNNKKESIRDTTYYKLNVGPNPNDTATRLKYMLTKKLVQEGKSLVVKYKNYLYVANSFSFASESILGYEFDNVTIQKSEIIDKKFNRNTSFYFELDDEKVKSILNEVDENYKSLVSYAMKVYRKAISNKWKLKIDSVKQHDPNFEKEFERYVKEQLKEFITGDEGVYPELNGYILEHLDDGDNKTDSSDIRNLRKDIFDMVAQAFKMPPSMMYGNVSNLKEVVNQFITFTVKPIAKMIGEEITRTLFSEQEVLKGKHVEVDISTINYKDIFDIATGVDKLISNGVANIDEVRAMINLSKLNSDFSKQHWITKNYSKVEDVMNAESENNGESDLSSQIEPSNSNVSDNNNDDSNDNSDNETLKGGDIDEEQK